MKLAINGGVPIVDSHQKLLQKWPTVTTQDIRDVVGVLNSGEFSGRNSNIVKEFEDGVATFIKVKNAVAFNSGTAALHACVAALGIGPGDEVIVPAFTFLASALSVLHNNAIPVFCDIDEKTFNIDPAKIESVITEKTKAIMVVHMQGLPAAMNDIISIAKKHKLFIIEDCAQSFGAKIVNKYCGTFGDIGAFSFMSAKQLATCGELGLICTDSMDLANKANMTKMYGEIINYDGTRSYNSLTMGFNYVAGTIQARFATNKLREFDKNVQKIIKNAEYLSEIIKKEFDFLEPPFVPDNYSHVYHFFRVRVVGGQNGCSSNRFLRQAIMDIMEKEGLKLRFYQTTPVSGQTIFKSMTGYGKNVPWAYNSEKMEFYKNNYKITNFPNTLKVISESFVVGGLGAAPLYFQDRKVVDAYIAGFRKVKENWSEVVKYANSLDKTYNDPWNGIAKISDTNGKFGLL